MVTMLYITLPWLFYNSKCDPLDPFHQFCSPPAPPLTSTVACFHFWLVFYGLFSPNALIDLLTVAIYIHIFSKWSKDSDAGKDWRQEERGMTEAETVRRHYRLNGHEFKQTLGVGDGQGSLACFCPCGCKESDMTEQLNWIEPTLCVLVS